MLTLQSVQPGQLLWSSAQLTLCALGHGEEVIRVPAVEGFRFAARHEPLECIGSDRVQHPESWLSRGWLLEAQQALVDERGNPVKDRA